MNTIHVCRFSAGLYDLSRKQQADHAVVLETLKRLGRYSCFEAGENRVIAKTMDSLHERLLLDSAGGAYPWSTCTVTELGEQFLRDGVLAPPPDPFEGFIRISKTVYVSLVIAAQRGLQAYIPPPAAAKSAANLTPTSQSIPTAPKGPLCPLPPQTLPSPPRRRRQSKLLA